MAVVVIMIVTDGDGCNNDSDRCGGCDDNSDRQMVVVVMMIVTDGCGCNNDSDGWLWL